MPKSAPIAKTGRTTKPRYDSRRGTSASRGYDRQWRKYRLRFLAANPLCVMCQRRGYVTAATVVDHVIPHRGNKELFDDETNHQGLCESCHNEKTASGE